MGYSPVTRREYECAFDGYFEVSRKVSEPTAEDCPLCGASADRVYTQAPQMTVSNEDKDVAGNSIPNGTSDMTEYEGWQRDTLETWKDKLAIENAGPDHIKLRKLIRRKDQTRTG